jgi:uncharacterized membrane protein
MKALSHIGRVQQLLIYIRSSLWFVPALIALSAILLALGLIAIDQSYGEDLRNWAPRLFAHESEGASAMLSAIATSMATVAGVVFSIVIVALSLASSQYSSRVLRNFMRDPATQTVLGVFLGIYAYCLIVLRTISSGDRHFVPSMAVLVGVLLALVAVGFFIFFIHHIASSIQVSEIAAEIMTETVEAIDRLYPKPLGDEDEPATDPACEIEAPPGRHWYPIAATMTGYMQTVDLDALTVFASEHDTALRMAFGVGEFVTKGHPVAFLALDRPPETETVNEVNRFYAVDGYRTIDQDPSFGVRQLVDIALKALSPSINDTTTAVTCIDHLSVILSHSAKRCLATRLKYEAGTLRLIACGPIYPGLVSLAFDQILENAKGNTEIMIRVLIALQKIGEATSHPVRRNTLIAKVRELAETAGRSIESTFARDRVQRQLTLTGQALEPYERFLLHPY